MPTFQANGLATLIGSLPVNNHRDALSLIFNHTPDIPLWPQLPCNPQEGMLSQFIEGMPGIIEENERTYFNIQTPSFEQEMVAYFEKYLAACEDHNLLADSPFAVSRERAQGLFALKEALLEQKGLTAVKGQITGPFTLLTGLHDQEGRAAYYDPTIREMAIKGLALKAAWQVRFLKESGLPVLMFIDEPALAGLGSSAFISISLADIGQDLNEVIDAIHNNGGLAGVHVCANTDWDFLLSSNIEVLSFDAYSFFDKLAVYKEKLYAFLDRGGIIAWGGVPTSEKEQIDKESADSLVALWEKQYQQLVTPQWDLAKLLRQTLITPSCGTGSLPLPYANKVLELTRDVSLKLRGKYLS
ncbi:MAG: hypothetical protein OEY01_10935 [Desulfobulbaceae bacterium]|nr:hypothetical protein [Desulfobulbaceae bacterium]HIJ79411.1 hypothetical protein [Deltaproteobacteria bacterium]